MGQIGDRIRIVTQDNFSQGVLIGKIGVIIELGRFVSRSGNIYPYKLLMERSKEVILARPVDKVGPNPDDWATEEEDFEKQLKGSSINHFYLPDMYFGSD